MSTYNSMTKAQLIAKINELENELQECEQELQETQEQLENAVAKTADNSPEEKVNDMILSLRNLKTPSDHIRAFQEFMQLSESVRGLDFWEHVDVSFTVTACFSFDHAYYMKFRETCKKTISKLTAKAQDQERPWGFRNGNILTISEHVLPEVQKESEVTDYTEIPF